MAHYKLASIDQSLPPILHIFIPIAVSSYSKGPRGLSVLPRVGGIFTSTTISLDPSLRQLPTRYAIHAGRYLTDKEFRYLRTVIVTAAVYSGFDRTGQASHPIHPLTCQQSAVFLVNSRKGLFVVTFKAFRVNPNTLVGTPYTEDTVLFCRVP